MHYLLERQLKKAGNNKFQFSAEGEALLQMVSNTYNNYDQDRRFLEHSFDLSSKEFLELNNKILKLKASVDQKVIERTKELKEEKKKAEAEKDKTMALITNFFAPIIFLNNNNQLVLFNPLAGEVLGVSEADLGAKVPISNNFSLNNFVNIIHNKFSAQWINNEPDSKFEEAIVKYKNEDRIFKVITSKVMGKAGDYLGTMKIFYDTTREKAIDKMKSEFISIAAHQLRTPLAAIKWIIKMILDGDAGELTVEQQELLNKGYLSNERIIKLVNDLLNVSRIEEGKFGFNFEKADFQEVLSAAVSNVESLVAKNHQELMIKKPPKLPKIFLDQERMIMVMQNLLSNAIKYTPEHGKIQVIIEVDRQYLHVKINDQGVGIPAKDQPKLFSKFFRAANVVKMETEGTGLGLFMVKNIIEKHNGRVSLKSEEGRGTEVAFYIPINRIANS